MKEKDLIREIQDLQTEIMWIKYRLEKLEKKIEKKSEKSKQGKRI